MSTRRTEEEDRPAVAVGSSRSLLKQDAWRSLSRWTPARIALGRAGASLPTAAVLAFDADHAAARDAIHAAFDTASLSQAVRASGVATRAVHSRAATRREFLARPDLGRSLDEESRAELAMAGPVPADRLTIVIADGLSSQAATRHALPLLDELRRGLEGWSLDDVILAIEARVALADEVGTLRGAEATLMLIGERPGLTSPDSLGAYLTYQPRVGRTDAERNCVSNIRAAGLGYDEAARRLLRLLAGARRLGATGVLLKEDGAKELGDGGGTFALR